MTEQEQKEFEELSSFVKANGYMKLDTHEKRTRYSELKKKSEGDSDTITLSKSELQAMIDKSIDSYKREAVKSFKEDEEGLNEAKAIGKWIKSKQPKKINSTATLRVYREDGLADGGLIIDWKFIKNIFNEETRRFDVPLYRIVVMYEDGNKEFDIPLLEMMKCEVEKLEVIKKEIEEQKMLVGVGQMPITKGSYSFSSPGMFGTKGQMSGDSFNYEVTRQAIVCTVKRESGQTFVIDSSKLNQ